jgi:hypothetical protein
MSLVMTWRLIALFQGLVCASSALAGHPGSLDLNPRQATAGLRLELQEVNAGGDGLPKKYRLRAPDYPRGIEFNVYTKDFSDSFTEVASGFRVDDTGSLVSSNSVRPRRLQDLELSPGPYPRGAVWEVAIASADRSVTAFTRTIPRPISARHGTCSLSLELLPPRGDRFLVTGSGFPAGDYVLTEFKIEGRLEQKQRKIAMDGQLPRHVITHAAIGIDRRARYSVKSQGCETNIDYEWGELALRRW